LLVRHFSQLVAIYRVNQIITSRNTRLLGAHNFINAAADTVTYYCRFVYFAAHDDSYTVRTAPPVKDILDRTELTAYRLAFLICKTETAVSLESVCSIDHKVISEVSVLLLPCTTGNKILVRNAFATLKTAALNNSAAGAGSHTLQKAVHFRAVAFLWLVGSFWHNYLSLYSINRYIDKAAPVFSVLVPQCYSFDCYLSENNNV
jgi:hypothetical protein